jgi:AcrR family transcriptional regulator
MATAKTKRSYDAQRRRERAEEERRATRRRVVDAARELFLTRGYVATTMSDIAAHAGVALQSVYNAGHSKADLLHLVADIAVGGDDDDVAVLDRPDFTAIGDETDPERQVEMIAGLIASTLERVAPVWVAYREAAAVDEKASANLEAAHRRRHETFAGMIGMLPEARLRRSREETTDTAWAIGSVDVFLLLRVTLGRSRDEYRDWLSRTLVDQLLAPAGTRRRSRS